MRWIVLFEHFEPNPMKYMKSKAPWGDQIGFNEAIVFAVEGLDSAYEYSSTFGAARASRVSCPILVDQMVISGGKSQ